MTHRRGSFRRSGISDSQRRKKVWGSLSALALGSAVSTRTSLDFFASSVVIQANQVSQSFGYVFVAANDLGAIPPESTILRIRGSLQLQKNTFAGTLQDDFAFGIGVMETGAANLAAFPNPATEAGSDWDGWMFHRSINSGVLDAASTFVDVKAMRKVESGYSLILVYGGVQTDIADTGLADAPSLTAQFTGRALVLLP